MPATDDLDALRAVRTIPDLLDYLRDRLDWPIEDSVEDLDELTFPYDAEEFGLKAEFAAKVRSIRQLRPLANDQPWGIFLVDFESKALPLVALRKILNGLAHKKRGGDRATWDKHDLLFISACGPEDERHVTFAHFSDRESDRLPVLEVLGWEEGDTNLKVEHVRRELETKLVWPDLDREDADIWRERWASAFTQRHREVIRTSKRLAERLAELARAIRDAVKGPVDDSGNLLFEGALDVEGESGPLTSLLNAFRASLIQDLGEKEFAGMYAQTIAYGLLAARVSRPAGLTPDDLPAMVPVTSPFLRDLLETFLKAGGRRRGGHELDFDELGVNEVVATLERANIEAVLRDFDHRNPQKDPVIHFYELFAKQFDPGEKIKRGEFYTPKPVVTYIVRSVHELLKSEFGLPDGLADTATWAEMADRNDGLTVPDGTDPDSHFVTILDPATGTGTFLVEAVDVIHRTLEAKWKAEGLRGPARVKAWNEYVPEHLLPRLYGYELKMAPYAVAHMKLGLKLTETGYEFPAEVDAEARVRVYLTNALEAPRDFQTTLDMPALAAEAKAVRRVKEDTRFTVVVGNPPYSIQSQNLTPELRSIVDAYKYVDGERIRERNMLQFEKNIQDDYVKFYRFAETAARSAGRAVVGLVTNHGFLDGATFRGMRWNLLKTFDRLSILDLHGNSNKREVSPDGSADENVFDISQGVAVSLAVRRPEASKAVGETLPTLLNLWGPRRGTPSSKYERLIEGLPDSVEWPISHPKAPLFLFAEKRSNEPEYDSWTRLDAAMPLFSMGTKTGRDGLTLGFTTREVLDNIAKFTDLTIPDREIADIFSTKSTRTWNLPAARSTTATVRDPAAHIRKFLYRPFNYRMIFYHPAVVSSQALPVMKQAGVENNLFLICTRQTKDQWDVQVAADVVGHKSLGAYDANSVFPVLIGSENGLLASSDGAAGNFSRDFIFSLLGPDENPSPNSRRAREIVAYIYSVFHSPDYRRRYQYRLRTDLPHVPHPRQLSLFADLAALGADLLALHLLESPLLDNPLVTYSGPVDPVVEKASYTGGTVWLDRAKTAGFSDVPQEVWDFHVGGYQVCNKWLQDRQAKGGENPRPGRVLSNDDLRHYEKIVTALHHTIRLMGEIDEVIDRHGGWPDAFRTATGPTESQPQEQDA